jgi:E3 ubiquitin-protein ligase NEDD4
MSSPEDHLIYFRFLGRVVGRALFDGQIIKGHMVRMLYKHLLGWPITIDDLKAQDEDYYESLKKFTTMPDVSDLCLDFTTTEEIMGSHEQKELVEGGSHMEVTNENLSEYLEASIKYRLFYRTMPQLTELLLGFYDVVPEPALTVFDANELELVLCGLPTIDLEDWQANTLYKGNFEIRGRSHPVVQWFWEVVSEFDDEMKARLLQFSTGTSGVPMRGFAYLQGIDGQLRKFTIQGIDRSYPFPMSHTCFNRIDLPEYDSKQELSEKLRIAVTTSHLGFGIE